MYKIKRKSAANKGSVIKRLLVGGAIFTVVVAAAGYVFAARWYNVNLRAVNRESAQTIVVNIPAGTSVSGIADVLETNGLIKNVSAFSWYLRINRLQSSLQAGDFELSPNMSVPSIVAVMGDGQLASESFTILPGKRLDQIKQLFKEAGYSENEVKQAFDPATYANHPISAYKPAGSSLEGYIFPETFARSSRTTAVELVTKSLDQMYAALDNELILALQDQGLSVHDAVILSSIVEKEVSNESDKPKVAQVFLKRLREGIRLGSDVTYFYAAAVYGGNATPSLDSPYNTRIYGGLPPGPIASFSLSSINAVANPSDTDYLFFVAGDNGTTYFNTTLRGHNNDAAAYCIELCKL